MICELSISVYETIRVLDGLLSVSELVEKKRAMLKWSEETLYEIIITEYLLNYIKMSKVQAEMFYRELEKDIKVRNEFYNLLVGEEYQGALEMVSCAGLKFAS